VFPILVALPPLIVGAWRGVVVLAPTLA